MDTLVKYLFIGINFLSSFVLEANVISLAIDHLSPSSWFVLFWENSIGSLLGCTSLSWVNDELRFLPADWSSRIHVKPLSTPSFLRKEFETLMIKDVIICVTLLMFHGAL